MAFKGAPDIDPEGKKIWLSSPTMHGEEQMWVNDALSTNWVSTVGENIRETERQMASYVGVKYAVALSAGTAALHLAARLAGEKLYGSARVNEGTLRKHRAFCSDLTFDASVNPVAYENGEAIFIDSERETWNMDPAALKIAFERYPDVRLIVTAHLYGTPAKMQEIREIAAEHGALIVEDAAESLGAQYRLNGNWTETGSLGHFNAISFNGNKIITGSSGGMFLTDDREDAEKVRKWSTQSREATPWYQHEELGYNYRMSNIVAGIVRGQIPHLPEHIEAKKAIYERYRKGLEGLPVRMNAFDAENSRPNFWLSCLTIEEDAMCRQTRDDRKASYIPEAGKSCPTEIFETLAAFQIESRPIWKPMHLQPIYRDHAFFTADGEVSCRDFAGLSAENGSGVGADIFRRGLCLPSDNKMTPEEQGKVIELIRRCFD